MFRPKDKYGFFIYTVTEALNGKEYAMHEDRYRNKGKTEIIEYEDFKDIYTLSKIMSARLNNCSYYTNANRWRIKNEIVMQCTELRYCTSIFGFILVIRRQPIIISENIIHEKFKGFYFIKYKGGNRR